MKSIYKPDEGQKQSSRLIRYIVYLTGSRINQKLRTVCMMDRVSKIEP